jgi:hypothetical protein
MSEIERKKADFIRAYDEYADTLDLNRISG